MKREYETWGKVVKQADIKAAVKAYFSRIPSKGNPA